MRSGGLIPLLSILLLPLVAAAQPAVRVSGAPQSGFHAIVFTFEQDDLPSMDGCHYNFFAADRAADLATLPGGLSIATFFRPIAVNQIIAEPLPRLSRMLGGSRKKRRYVKVYFRTLLACPGATNGMGELFSLTIRTAPRGRITTVNRLIKKMKFNMRYFN